MVWPIRKPAVLVAVTVLEKGFTRSDGTRWVEVSARLPARNRPDRFVTVTRIGGRQDHPATDDARLRVDCYGKTVGEVEHMAAAASEILRNASGSTVEVEPTPGDRVAVFIRAWGNEDGPVDYPHPDIFEFDRWQLTGTLSVKSN